MANLNIENVKCEGCGQPVFKIVSIVEKVPRPGEYPTNEINGTTLIENAPPLCTDGHLHRVSLTDLM